MVRSHSRLPNYQEVKIASKKRIRKNEEIKANSVRVIDDDGEQLGILLTSMAITRAKAGGLDLVEVSPNAEPPVCRMMNFGKYIFELNKKSQSNKKKQRQSQIKEIKFRPNTEIGDYQVKLRKLTEFLADGDKVKITLRFKGREFEHKHLGGELMKRIKDDLVEIAQIEQEPQLEGRQMVMVFSSKK